MLLAAGLQISVVVLVVTSFGLLIGRSVFADACQRDRVLTIAELILTDSIDAVPNIIQIIGASIRRDGDWSIDCNQVNPTLRATAKASQRVL